MEPTLPIYHQIRRYLKNAILDKTYPPNHQIPPENELAKQFNVNRITIRQSISSLVDEGLLKRKRGKGTFVTNDESLIQKISLKNISLTSELLLPLKSSKTLSVSLETIEPTPVIIEKLELDQNVKYVSKIVRDRIVSEGCRAYTINYLPYEIGNQLTPQVLKKKPLLLILEEDLKINFTEAFQTIESSFADAETAEHLGIRPGSQTLLTERIVYGGNGKPVELVRTIYSADQYKCCLSLKKIKIGSSHTWVCQITK